MSDYSQLVYLALCLLCVWLILSLFESNRLMNTLTDAISGNDLTNAIESSTSNTALGHGAGGTTDGGGGGRI